MDQSTTSPLSEADSLKNNVSNALSPIKTLFCGQSPDYILGNFPSISQSEEETLQLIGTTIRTFLESHTSDFVAFDRKAEQPLTYIDELKELGLFGVIIPQEYSGVGFSSKAYARVLEMIGEYDGSTGLTVGAHSSIGMKGLLLYGTDSQKAKYLPKLASGQMIAAFCLTEPLAGSDAQSLTTSVKKDDNGSYVLSGEKIWITNGSLAHFFTVFARHIEEPEKISAFIVEREFGGVRSGPKEDKMGIRASATTSVYFDEVVIPPENRLGTEGDGFKIAMAILNSGRTGLGGGCVGAMKRCLKLAIEHAQSRGQFQKRIIEFPLIQEKLTLIAMRAYATRSIVQVVGGLIDDGYTDYSLESAASKVYGSESLWLSANDALQVAGGAGFMRDLPFEMIVRDARINLIFEGTNEILRLYIALSGMKVVGNRLHDISDALISLWKEPIKGFGLLSDYVATRARGTGISIGLLQRPRRYTKELQLLLDPLAVYASRLAQASEGLLRKHGKTIVDRQLDLKRVADCAIDLFVSFSTISQTQQSIDSKTEQECKYERSLATLVLRDGIRRSNQSLRRLLRNEDSIIKSIVSHLQDRGVE
jgi:acyl-CoA dehydrogenase family member 9